MTVEQLLTAVLAVLLDEREQRVREQPAARKPEALLADAGLPVPVIATLLGKQPSAVRMSVSRARSKPAGSEKQP
ncbi:MAG TPA: hypothetical protein VNB24_09140 [Acidimicrobiales bacterium]|nr:hypothetical protein [Acidimicrobiales bacterium]